MAGHKKGERTKPANHSPVSLLSNVGKVFERVLFKHIYNHLYINNLLYKYQSGFLPGHSTTLQLIDIYHHICQSLRRNNILTWCIVIFRKLSIESGIGVYYLN